MEFSTFAQQLHVTPCSPALTTVPARVTRTRIEGSAAACNANLRGARWKIVDGRWKMADMRGRMCSGERGRLDRSRRRPADEPWRTNDEEILPQNCLARRRTE